MTMVEQSFAVLLLIDDGDGFWVTEEWDLEPQFHVPYSIGEILPLPLFSSGQGDAVQALRKRIDDTVGRDWSVRAHELYVITDSNFGVTPDGGAQLLHAMAATEELRWRRAVVYSEDPWLPDRGDGLLRDALAVKKSGDASNDQKRILEFLSTGRFPSLQPLWKLISELNTLAACCRDCLLLPSGDFSRLWPVERYGKLTPQAAIENPFAPLFTPLGGASPFSLDTCEMFSSSVEAEFMSYCTAAVRLGSLTRPRNDEREYWNTLVRALHPIASLDPSAGPIRHLWELLHTSGDQRHIDGHPALSAWQLGARERSWIRTRLRHTLQRFSPDQFAAVVTAAVEEWNAVTKISQAVASAASWSSE